MRPLNVCFLAVLYGIVPCKTDHFQGGTISWKPTGNGREVEFNYKLGWTLSSSFSPGCTSSRIGQYLDRKKFTWICTSGCGSSVSLSSAGYTCTAVSNTQDWEQGEHSFRYTFTSDGPFTVTYDGCCWIGLDYGTGDGYWNIPTTVDLRTRSDLNVPNSSPVAASKYIYTIKYGCTQTLTIPVLDNEGDNVRCRWAVGDECSSACRRIPNTVLDQDKCTLTIAATNGKGDTYAVAIMVEDRPRSTITLNGQTFTPNHVLSSVPVQFLVITKDIPSRACSDRPVFVHPTPEESEVIVVPPGETMFVTFYASSKGTSIQSFLFIGPPGLQQSSNPHLTLRPGVYSSDVMWTPSAADKGLQSLCAEASDTYSISSDLRCVTIAAWDIDPCDSDPCQNCGTCARVGRTDSFQCSCLDGYTGALCETEINECVSKPCQNGATCTDIVNGFYCTCSPGYEGVLCHIDINECQSSPCMNNGTCFDHVNSFQCACQPGFTGSTCQVDIDECISRPCLNNGTCIDGVNGYSCVCSPGFTGSNCEIDIDECQSVPCFNNGTCHDMVNSYICECQPGYTGTLCEIDIDECQSYPCLHNGTCFDLINNFFCGCVNGYTGNQCEIDIDDCMDKPCLNGGNCTDLLASFTCSCPPAFTGEICQTGIDPCSSMPCKNNGECLSHNSTYFTCSCLDGWGGINCAYRYQNESFVNSSYMTGLHMRYSECDCFLGNAEKQLCCKYKKGNSIGYGVLGMFLGLLTVVGLYVVSECFQRKELPPNVERIKTDEQIKHKDDHPTKGGNDDADVEAIPMEQKKTEPKKVKPHIHGHRHRKCWACEVKYNNATPPRFW